MIEKAKAFVKSPAFVGVLACLAVGFALGYLMRNRMLNSKAGEPARGEPTLLGRVLGERSSYKSPTEEEWAAEDAAWRAANPY